MDVPRPVDCSRCGAALHAEADWCWRCLAPVLVRVPDVEVLPSPSGPGRRAPAVAAGAVLGVGALALGWAWVGAVGWAGLPLAAFLLGMAALCAVQLHRLTGVGRHPSVLIAPRPRRIVRVDGPPVP
ncbi:MAG TPA: hypothetical protein VNO17_04520, partial [Actinomycetota bacterium]|nr:hypothetical protein [Actinomycetota bacterium]